MLRRTIFTRTAVVGAAVAVFAACDTLGLPGSVEVRVENQSTLTFSAVEYFAGSDLTTVPLLEPGRSSPYVEADGAYAYTTIQVVVEADTLRLQVIDYVGETPLSGGRYTYVLSVDGPSGSRTLLQELRHDS